MPPKFNNFPISQFDWPIIPKKKNYGNSQNKRFNLKYKVPPLLPTYIGENSEVRILLSQTNLVIKTKEYFLSIATTYSYRWKYVFRRTKFAKTYGIKVRCYGKRVGNTLVTWGTYQ
jgi:hypothetical protein